MRYNTKLCLTTYFVLLFLTTQAQTTTKKHRVFVGAGNNNVISDVVSLTDKSFLGEISGQLRCGLRLFDNYEINFGAHYRNYPGIDSKSNLTYNKLIGYSGALIYEFRKPDSKWGVPFGFEMVKYQRHLDSALSDGSAAYDHYNAFSYGPKIALRYHFSRFCFVETEANFLYEHFVQDVKWNDNVIFYDDFTMASFKFIGISLNLGF